MIPQQQIVDRLSHFLATIKIRGRATACKKKHRASVFTEPAEMQKED